jgi:predicted nucleic-acid-binding Zn-ribbon protein
VGENEVRQCPKCWGTMELGYLPGAWNWSAGKSLWRFKDPRRIFGHACKNCGYVEFYLEKKTKRKKTLL